MINALRIRLNRDSIDRESQPLPISKCPSRLAGGQVRVEHADRRINVKRELRTALRCGYILDMTSERRRSIGARSAGSIASAA